MGWQPHGTLPNLSYKKAVSGTVNSGIDMDMQQITKIVTAWELFNQDIPQTHIARLLDIHRDTIRLWLGGVRQLGLELFLEKYQSAKKGPRVKSKKTKGIKNLICEIREKERYCCGQKIKYFLEQDYGIKVGTTLIYEVLNERYQLRSKWKKNKLRGPVSIAHHAREVIQMDTVDFGDIFAFTGIDIFSKETDVLLRPSLTSHDGLVFLETAMERRFGGYSDLIQADGGPEFKDEFKNNVLRFAKRYRVARPYRKNEQSYIESFNRSFRKECLGWAKYKPVQLPELTQEVNNYLNWYHQRRPHLGLNMKPPLQINQVPDF